MPFTGNWDAYDNLGNGYMRDENPHRKQHPYSAYDLLPPLLDMPVDMEGVMVREEIEAFGSLLMDPPINAPMWCAIEFHTVKEWATDWPHSTITDVGHIFWCDFVSIPASWVLIDAEEAYKLLTEEEYGQKRPGGAKRAWR